MTNLTITVDEQTLKRARIRALEEDTSVSAVLREYLEELHRRAAGGTAEDDQGLTTVHLRLRSGRTHLEKREDAYEEHHPRLLS